MLMLQNEVNSVLGESTKDLDEQALRDRSAVLAIVIKKSIYEVNPTTCELFGSAK